MAQDSSRIYRYHQSLWAVQTAEGNTEKEALHWRMGKENTRLQHRGVYNGFPLVMFALR